MVTSNDIPVHNIDYDRLKAILEKEEYSSFSKTGSKNTSGSMFSVVASPLIDHHEALSRAWR